MIKCCALIGYPVRKSWVRSFLWLRALSRKKSIRFKIYRSFSGNYCSSKILSYYIGARTVLGEHLDRPLNLERPRLIPHKSKCLEKYHGWGQLKCDIWSLIWNLRIARCKISDWITMWILSSPWLFGSFFSKHFHSYLLLINCSGTHNITVMLDEYWAYSRTPTNSHLHTTVHFYGPADGRHILKIVTTTTTSTQRQGPLKRVSNAKITPRQRPVN